MYPEQDVTMLSIQTNVAALTAEQNLNINDNFMNQTITQLTSGYRINSSGDDPAGLVVANQYRSNVAELTQGVENANDGVSQLQIIDGGLSNISTILDSLKTLATEAASDTFTGSLTTIDAQYQDLIGEINRQADNIGLGATGGSDAATTAMEKSLNVYIGGNTPSVTVDLSAGAVDATSLGLTGGVSSATDAIAAISQINSAVSALGVVQGTVGSSENKLNYAINLANSQITSFSAAEGQIRDADMATEAANLTKAQVLQQSTLAAMAQANAEPQAILSLLKSS
jgi:flagellin